MVTPSHTLDYAYDGDTSGVFHYIASKGGTEPYATPDLVVTRSSRGAGLPIDLVTDECATTNCTDTNAEELGWWCVDLGEDRRLRCNHYALRHGRACSGDRMRYWRLEASIDGEHWWTLRDHVDDRSYHRAASRWCSFAVLPDLDFAGRPTTRERARSPRAKSRAASFRPASATKEEPRPAKWARYVRVRLTRPRQNSERSLTLSRLELYGELSAPREYAASGGATKRIRLLRSPGDALAGANADTTTFSSGVLYHIGTRFGLQKWHHPTRVSGNTVVASLSTVGRGAVGAVLARAPREKAAVCSTTSRAGLGTFTLDLGAAMRLLPTHYSIRHGYNNGGHRLQSWVFEASADGDVWRTLREHSNDAELRDESFASASWELAVPTWKLPLPDRAYAIPPHGRAPTKSKGVMPPPVAKSTEQRERQLACWKRKMLERYDDDPSFVATALQRASVAGELARTRDEFANLLDAQAENSLEHAQPWARWFRIRMTGLNTSERDVLTISAIELWGVLEAPKSSGVRTTHTR